MTKFKLWKFVNIRISFETIFQIILSGKFSSCGTHGQTEFIRLYYLNDGVRYINGGESAMSKNHPNKSGVPTCLIFHRSVLMILIINLWN